MSEYTTCLAEEKCRQRGRDFGWLFRNQYVLSRDQKQHYPGWEKKLLSGWVLHHGTALRNCPILDANGQKVGFLLGYALTPESVVVEGRFVLPVKVGSDDFAIVADRCLTELAGLYMGILLTKGCERIYCDPVCDIPLLYDAKSRKVASSLGLLLNRNIRFNPDFPLKNVLAGKQMINFGISLDKDVRRGIANHFLDLKDFSMHRHWPNADMNFDTDYLDIPSKVDQLTERLSAHLAALINRFDCILPVTGGRDSRVLLSCALPVIDKVKELSGYRFHNPSRVDIRIAREMLATLGLPYKQYFKKKASQTQLRDLRLKTGWSTARAETIALAMLEEYPQDHLVLRGNILELLRAHHWRHDTIGAPFRMMHAVRRIKVGAGSNSENKKKWAPHYSAWYDALPECARPYPYDFAYIEQVLPNAQGAYYYGFNQNVMINAFSDRKLFELILSMPVALRKDETIVRLIIQRTNPFLLDTPFH